MGRHVTVMMVLSCATWLRLLVTAVLCVAGVVRADGQRSDTPALADAQEPEHLLGQSRQSELSHLRKRAFEDCDDSGLVEVLDEQRTIATRHLDVVESKVVHPTSAWQERPRARGPPSA